MANFNCILFDPQEIRVKLYPLTLTRSISEIRLGIRTIKEQWEDYIKAKCYIETESYLQPKYGEFPSRALQLFINGSCVPNEALAQEILDLKPETELVQNGICIARLSSNSSFHLPFSGNSIEYSSRVLIIERPWHIFSKNEEVLKTEFNRLTIHHTSMEIPAGVVVIGSKEDIYIDNSAVVMPSVVLNTQKGPIYIGSDCEIMEGSTIRGPFAMLDHATAKMASKIYGATTLGPHVKVGGEISNSVIFGYSNKGHDGFLGNSVIGEWCNLGADTNNSNLKNNYSEVKVYSYFERKEIGTGIQFCGLTMGDHSKSGINTMFNTGTVVGVSANVYGSDFPPKMIKSFSWGTAQQMEDFVFDKALEVAERMMERRSLTLSETDKSILLHIYNTRN